MGAQDRKYISKMSRFRVTAQKVDSKKGPKSQITQQIILGRTSEWYQSIGLKILHHICLPQKNPLGSVGGAQKNTNTPSVSICPGVTSQ